MVNGLAPNSVYGFRVHEFGDLSDGCISCGDNFGNKGGNIFSNLIDKLGLCRNRIIFLLKWRVPRVIS